jgi:seryl-tRNA synthetase
MLDIQQLRNDLDGVVSKLKKRGFEFDAASFTALELERKTVQTNTEALQAKRNAASKGIGFAWRKSQVWAMSKKQVKRVWRKFKSN